MKFLKKKLLDDNNIFKNEVTDEKTKSVVDFYNESPFPNYKINDNKNTILEKGNKNFIASSFKKLIGFNKDVLEVGCGTGQISNFFAIGTNNRIVALDPTFASLKIASNFSLNNNIKNINYINADIFDDVLQDSYFDFIWCNGVLHHTKNPHDAFKILTKYLKKNGYILIGLYNKIGRIRTILRRYLYKIFGERILYLLDPTLRNLKSDPDEIKSWIRDQYIHPIEFTHTLDETLNWFDQNEIEFINSIPSCNFDENYVTDLFKKESRGSLFTRITNQISMIFNNLGSDGGLFVIVGRKK
jgi:2-polyprenyl-3-methyl-5-hydroxy-6-metoxy-1,4-benzoquinol methylase